MWWDSHGKEDPNSVNATLFFVPHVDCQKLGHIVKEIRQQFFEITNAWISAARYCFHDENESFGDLEENESHKFAKYFVPEGKNYKIILTNRKSLNKNPSKKELSARGSVLILDYLSLNYDEIIHNETEFDSHSIKRRELENLHHEARSLRDLDNLLVASPDVESEGSADNFEQIGVDFIPDLFFDSSSSSSDFSFYDDVSSSDTTVYNGEVLSVFETQIL